MRVFNIYGGIKGKKLEESLGVECESMTDALKKAKELANEVYYLNPNYDILEIMEIENVDEETATAIFNSYMERFTDWKVIEVTPMEIEVTTDENTTN